VAKGDDVEVVMSVRGDQLGQRPCSFLAEPWFSWCWSRNPVLGRLGAGSQNPSRSVLQLIEIQRPEHQHLSDEVEVHQQVP
jgi:hypothetical protein